MASTKRAQFHAKIRRRLELHWSRMLYTQLGAYLIVLVLWTLPIPNPVKLLAVSFHELSHGIAAIATGGRVFGYAIAPGGAGVTMGIGGNMHVILLAGYLGSVAWGAMLYAMSVKMDARHALITLLLFIMGTGVFGWLNEYTYIFALGAMVLIMMLFPAPTWAIRFFLRLVGSACCLYAPLELVGDVFGLGRAPSVKGMETPSDLTQLTELLGLPLWLIAFTILALQSAALVFLIRWTCNHGAREAVREEIRLAKEKRRLRQDVVPHEKKRYVIR